MLSTAPARPRPLGPVAVTPAPALALALARPLALGLALATAVATACGGQASPGGERDGGDAGDGRGERVREGNGGDGGGARDGAGDPRGRADGGDEDAGNGPDAAAPPDGSSPPDSGGDGADALPADLTSDTGGDGGGPGPDAGDSGSPTSPSYTSCYPEDTVVRPDYDQFGPTLGRHCLGTNHQAIGGLDLVVFLGDSITAGTPPTTPANFYRNELTDLLEARFGPLEVRNCSVYGARTDDLIGGDQQLADCFPEGTEPLRTLVVMTLGGNDIAAWAKDKLPTDEARAEADAAAAELRAGIDWLLAPGRFPSGVFVVFANVYEYTDGTGDLGSCPTAGLAGFSGTWAEGIPAVVHFQEQLLRIAVETGTDMIFLGEHFCGHGYRRNDPDAPCYQPGNPLWFDLTCIHPTPEGHDEIARLFDAVIGE